MLIIDPDEKARTRAKAQEQDARDDPGDCLTRDGDRITLLAESWPP